MKTLILNGSPRKNGDTAGLLNKLIEKLHGECKIVNAYYADISPCIDCRYCWRSKGCSIHDVMAEIYDYLEDCDNVVIASPVYFSQPTGKLLAVCSRFQTYFAAKYFRKEEPSLNPKKGAVILVGGGDGSPESAYKTACVLLRHVNVTEIFPMVGSFHTNELPAAEDHQVMESIAKMTAFLNNEF